jgi:Zn-finger nucleic acid-binding protein
VCPSCGGGVRKACAACPYCGAEVVLPKPKGADAPAERRTFCTRCGRLYPTRAARCPKCPPAGDHEKGSRCPRCAGALEVAPMGGVRVDRCPGCRGVWFDGEEVEHALDVTTKGVGSVEARALKATLPARKGPFEEVRYLACVRCGELMARRQLAPLAGVIVDVCRDHGVWFDAGELEHFAAFVAAGGLEVMRHDEVASVEARMRAASTASSPTRPVVWMSGERGIESVVGSAVLRGIRRLLRGLF